MRFRAVLPALLTILTSCDSGSSSDSSVSDPYVPSDPVPFVQSTTPLSYAVGVAASQVISARFSEPMLASTLSSSSVLVATSTGSVAGTVSMSPDLREVRIAPTAPLTVNRVYSVTLTAAIRSSSGQSMASAYSWPFATGLDWEWSPAELLESSAGMGATDSYPHIAIDSQENAAAVWTQYDDALVYRVYAARAPAGGPWESPIIINGGLGTNKPLIDFGAPGQLVAVCGNGTRIWASRATMTGAWSTPELAGEAPSGTAVIHAMFFDPAGNIVVFYHESIDGQQFNNLYSLRYDPLGGWLAREAIPAHNMDFPAFAGDDSGTVVALWTPFNNPYSVIARRFTPASGWSADETVSAYESGQVGRPYVTLDGSGNILAVWWRRIGGGWSFDRQFYISRRGTASPWTVPAPVPTGGQVAVNFPAAALAPDGSAVITWRFNSDYSWAVHQGPDGDWETPAAVSTVDGNLIRDPATPFYSGFGRFAIVGKQSTYFPEVPGAETGMIWMTEYRPSTGFGSPSVIYSVLGDIFSFSVTWDGMGRGAAIWQEDGPRNVACARFR